MSPWLNIFAQTAADKWALLPQSAMPNVQQSESATAPPVKPIVYGGLAGGGKTFARLQLVIIGA